MLHKLALAAFVVVFGGGVALADVIITPRPPNPTPTEPPTTPPTNPPTDHKSGCSSRDALAAEWMFGLAAFSIGAWGLRRFTPRRQTAS